MPRAQDIKAIKDYLRDTNINHLKQLLKAETFQLLEFIKDLPDFRSFIPEFSTGKRYIGVKSLRLLADWNKMIVDTVCLSSIEREKLHDKRVREVKSLQKNEIKQFEKAVTQFVKRFSQSADSKKQSNIPSQRNLYNMFIRFQEEGKKKLKPKSYYSSLEAGFEEFKRFVKDCRLNLDAAPQLKAKLWEVYKEHYKKRLTFLRVSFGYLAIYMINSTHHQPRC